MSMRYKGGRISATHPTTSQSSASGVWTLEQQLQANASGAWPGPPNYIEDVFSTFLYVGDGTTNKSIVNNIDLANQGGLVWVKGRDVSGGSNHYFRDSARGVGKILYLPGNDPEINNSTAYIRAFNADGFNIGNNGGVNTSNNNYASWTFRKQAKFFDVVTYTGNAVAGRTVAHNLGSVPGCIIIKRTDNIENWAVYHRSLGNTASLSLNLTNASGAGFWNNTTPTSTVFTLGTAGQVNDNGSAYVAYLFAHDAGGFGPSFTDNVISCGSYTGNGSTTGPTVTLNYEPQWIMIKRTDTAGTDWWMFDNMRGLTMGADADLRANLTQAEEAVVNNINPTATGFSLQSTTAAVNASGGTYIYIAIRRGPMKTPTSGTSVFTPTKVTGSSVNQTYSVGFPADLFIGKDTLSDSYTSWVWQSRLTYNAAMSSNLTSAESIPAWGNDGVKWDRQNSIFISTTGYLDNNPILYTFRRAPGFFDVVCYTGTGSNTTFTHNLGVVPELMIVKKRSAASSVGWFVYSAALGATERIVLNLTDAKVTTSLVWNNTTPTATVFSLGTATEVNQSAETYVAYLFATVTGVSKVGSYTGTGTTKQIDCGFAAGARFVMIKRTDSTGGWYVWDSARGIVAGNDPYLLLNSNDVQVTNTDYIDTYSLGFEISSTAPTEINANGGTYIFLAIA